MRYVSHDAMREFETRFPDAAAFLLHHDLKGELATLRSQNEFNVLDEWHKKRLQDLENLEASTSQIQGDHYV